MKYRTFELKVKPEFIDAIDSLADSCGLTREQILDVAIHLLEEVVKEDANGNEIKFVKRPT